MLTTGSHEHVTGHYIVYHAWVLLGLLDSAQNWRAARFGEVMRTNGILACLERTDLGSPRDQSVGFGGGNVGDACCERLSARVGGGRERGLGAEQICAFFFCLSSHVFNQIVYHPRAA